MDRSFVPTLDDPVTAPFWRAARSHRFELQHCDECGFVRWPPAPVCPRCLGTSAQWREVSNLGRVWSYAFYYRAYSPSFADALPYCVAMVQLDSGPTMIARVDGVTEDSIAIGDRVEARFDDVSDEVALVVFTLSRSTVQENTP